MSYRVPKCLGPNPTNHFGGVQRVLEKKRNYCARLQMFAEHIVGIFQYWAKMLMTSQN